MLESLIQKHLIFYNISNLLTHISSLKLTTFKDYINNVMFMLYLSDQILQSINKYTCIFIENQFLFSIMH